MHRGLQDPLIELRQPQLGREFNDVLVESIDETITDLLSQAVVDALYAHLQTIYSIRGMRSLTDLTLYSLLWRRFLAFAVRRP